MHETISDDGANWLTWVAPLIVLGLSALGWACWSLWGSAVISTLRETNLFFFCTW